MLPHASEERYNVIAGLREDYLTVVEHKTYPQVVHEDRESRHDGKDAPGSAKLIPVDALAMQAARRQRDVLGVGVEELVRFLALLRRLGLSVPVHRAVSQTRCICGGHGRVGSSYEFALSQVAYCTCGSCRRSLN